MCTFFEGWDYVLITLMNISLTKKNILLGWIKIRVLTVEVEMEKVCVDFYDTYNLNSTPANTKYLMNYLFKLKSC